MKRLKIAALVVGVLSASSVFAQTEVNLVGGGSTLIRAGQDVRVTCTAAEVPPRLPRCLLKKNNNGYFYVELEGQSISDVFEYSIDALKQLQEYRKAEICL